MSYEIDYSGDGNGDTIQLPASKSESNRLLVLNFLAGNHTHLNNLSESGDTLLMRKNLELIKKQHPAIDCNDAGTVFRFLLSVCAISPGEYVLSGTERLHQRPIFPLVEALRQIGADITYLEKQGFAPLRVRGKKLQGGKISVDGALSSQFISSLLLVAPFLPGGLHLELTGAVPSKPYIKLTLSALTRFGVSWTWKDTIISVNEGLAAPTALDVENDWSSLSYFLPVIALNGKSLTFPGLKEETFQGDKAMLEMMRYFGLKEEWHDSGLTVLKEKILWEPRPFTVCFMNYPDLVPAFLSGMILLEMPQVCFSGLESLRHKESDRTAVLSVMATECGYSFTEDAPGSWMLLRREHRVPGKLQVFSDHRMAMSFALLAIKFGKIRMDDVHCVKKSFPGFWRELSALGFAVSEK